MGPNDGSGQFTIPQTAHPPPPDGPARVRGRPRRRILLHPQPARAALAVRARHLSRTGPQQALAPAGKIPRAPSETTPSSGSRSEVRYTYPACDVVHDARWLRPRQVAVQPVWSAAVSGSGSSCEVVSRAATAQQLNRTRPHEPPPGGATAPLLWLATQGFVVGAVAGIPRWHARAQASWLPARGDRPVGGFALSRVFRDAHKRRKLPVWSLARTWTVEW